MDSSPTSANPMLGSQLIGKSILAQNQSESSELDSQAEKPTSVKEKSQQEEKQAKSSQTQASKQMNSNKQPETNNNLKTNNKSIKSISQLEPTVQQVEAESASNKKQQQQQQKPNFDLELLAKETQELKTRTRKLQLEVEEKNDIIGVLREELETTKEENDKFQRDNLQLIKDAKRVQFLQDENDFLQDKLAGVDKLELEIKRLKEKLAELDFLKVRVKELEDDKLKAQEEISNFDSQLKLAESRLLRFNELELEVNKWKSFSQELEVEKNSIQAKLIESIEQENKLNINNKQVEDEVQRLKSLVKSLEQQRDEEQASNSLIMCSNNLQQLDQQQQQQHQHQPQNSPSADNNNRDSPTETDTSIKFELDKQIEKELNEQNSTLKQKLSEKDTQINQLIDDNRKFKLDLESKAELINNLRQDLSCEKNLASKLTKQLTSCTKQIKSLDRQYLPLRHSDDISANSKPTTNGEKQRESSPAIERVTSSPLNCQHKNSTLLSVVEVGNHQKMMNDEPQCNNSDVNRKDKTESERIQLKDSSSKLSKVVEEQQLLTKSLDNQATSCAPKTGSQLDNRASNSAEPEIVVRNLLSIAVKENEADYLAPESVSMTNNKSTVLSKPNSESNPIKIRAETRASSKEPVSESSNNNGNSISNNNNASYKLTNVPVDTPNKSLDRLSQAKRSLLRRASPMNNNEDELDSDRKYGHASFSNNNNNNNSNGYLNGSANGSYKESLALHSLTSVSPSSNTTNSQACSPSVSANIGHDSGFQSINHGK